MTRGELHGLRSVYFVGIGGIGMSALARYFRHQGVAVNGYDRTETYLTFLLTEEGIGVSSDMNDVPPSDTDLVVYTPAIKSHPVYAWAEERGIRRVKRAEVLGWLSAFYTTIAIAGTHGKTTTSALVAHLLQSAGLSPTALLGGVLGLKQTNFLAGDSDWLVVEADEYDRSFLQLNVDYAIVTSTAADHLDVYGEAEKLHEAFGAFVLNVHPKGALWLQGEVSTALKNYTNCPVYTYGMAENVDNSAKITQSLPTRTEGEMRLQSGEVLDFLLPMAGAHNVENALAAASLAHHLGVTVPQLNAGLVLFPGVDRRYTIHYQSDRWAVIDDYAHHPDEIAAAIAATRAAFAGWHLVAVFQPHLYSRTRDFAAGFAETLSQADTVFLLDIYPAREEPLPGVTADVIYQQIRLSDSHRVTLDSVAGALEGHLVSFSGKKVAVLVMGAGSVATVLPSIAGAIACLDTPLEPTDEP